MAAHGLVNDPCSTGVIGLVDNGILAMKHPVLSIHALDTHTGFVAGDNAGGPKAGLGGLCGGVETRTRAGKHVHDCALAHIEAEDILEGTAQAFVGQRMETLEVDRQRVNAWPEGCRGRHSGCSGLCRRATMWAMTGITAVPGDIRTDRRNIDLVIGPGQHHGIVAGKRMAASLAGGRFMIAKHIGYIRQNPVVGFMPGLGSTRSRVDSLLLLVRRGRLGRRPRILGSPLEPKHHLDQFVLTQLLQISPIHTVMDSDIVAHGKGVSNYRISKHISF